MKYCMLHRRMLMSALPGKMIMVIGILFFVTSSWATQLSLFGPPSDFMNSTVVIKTETGISHLSIRLVEFLMGIQTDKSWEKKSDTLWILRTGFKDPVTEMHKTYVLEFEKVHDVIILSAVSFDNHMFSLQEVKSFVEQMIRNFGQHVSPK
ncbi:MAG: hypothetical protein FJ241_10805 [Nitrospira sp.]|nr:hypothetical protein [Nitrospira sp.]